MLSIGQMISHYQILEKLGEGGMGIVYKGQDTELDRIVALKFLPQRLTSNDAERARFLQEAKAASALNHPNVCTIYGIDEFEGQKFIEMEYVDGMTLRENIARSSLAVNEAIRFGIQIGEALHEAHSKGIVHRDIKCENIMVNAKSQIKVMDFGLAKLKGSLKLTRTSSTVGTLAYMAPEQIQGGEVDARSDIFSFGVVLFEMLTGHMPFRGEHEAAIMYSLLNEEPEPVRKYRPEAAADLDRIVRRALEKDPADRYQHVDDIVSELRHLQKASSRVARPEVVVPAKADTAREKMRPSQRKWWIGIAGLTVGGALVVLFFLRPGTSNVKQSDAGRKMLVVLPFENLGGVDQEYFADGMTEEITSKLSGLSGLGVIARSSAMQYKKTSKPLKQIGDELGVSYILQGTIRWETANGTTRVRVNPQLINVADGTQMWSQPSEAVLAGAFKLQSEIAGEVANALDLTLLQHEKQSLEAKLTENSEAYDYYLRGNEYTFRGYQEKDLRIAEQMYKHAVELDPKFAKAYAQLAALHAELYWEFYDHTEERVQKSKEAAETSLRLDPDLPDAHGAMGWYYYHGRLDYVNALREFNQALSLQPNNALLLIGIASVFRRQGKMDDALVRFKKAAEVDPRSADFAEEVATTLNLMRNFAEAERFYNKAISIAPDVVQPYCDKAFMYVQWKGNLRQAREVLDEAARQKTDLTDPYFTYNGLNLDILEKNYEQAISRIDNARFKAFDLQYWYIPKEMAFASVEERMKNAGKARDHYNKALGVLESEIKSHPEDSRLHSSLGIVYAALNRKAEAIREGQQGADLLPISKDAILGTIRLQDLAEIYTMVGEEDKAVGLLQQLLQIPSLVTPPLLRVDPLWDALRGNPRFQKLVAEN